MEFGSGFKICINVNNASVFAACNQLISSAMYFMKRSA